MQIIQFEIDHFDMMDLDELVSKENRALYEGYPKAGPAITLISDKMEPVASAGVVCVWKGMGEFWMIPSKLVPQYPLTIWKEAKAFIADSVDRFQLRRIQATIREKDFRAIRWIEKLGFQREGLLRSFGANGENHYMYARLNDV